MPNSPQDFLDQAKVLQVNSSCEMEFRTATNRGYYCVYHVAANVKNRLSLPDATHNTKGGSHARLFNSLSECKPRHSTQYIRVMQLGIMANRLLKPYRVNADYGIDGSFPASIMNELVEKASFLLENSDKIIAEHQPGTSTPQHCVSKPSLKIVK